MDTNSVIVADVKRHVDGATTGPLGFIARRIAGIELDSLERTRDQLEAELREHRAMMDNLRESRGVKPGAITPDTLRYSSAWEIANNQLHVTFRKLQQVNAQIVKLR